MVGRHIAHYEILEKLGEGGMGAVYKARDSHLDRFVAIKVLSGSVVPDARRLSLKRALAIRQVLIDAGVSSTRINVHAEGGVDDSGPADRVDVFVRA